MFSNRSTRPDTMFRFFTGTLRSVWLESVIMTAVELLTLRLLDEVAKLPYGPPMIRQLRKICRQLFGLNIIAAEALEEVIDGWDRSGGGRGKIILPSM